MAPHLGILVPQSEQPVAAQSAPSSNCICLTFLENRRKARKHMGILLLFAFPSPRHLAGASQRSRQVRGSARSLWYPDSFLTSCNCFPATTLLSRELLAKAICSPSIFISCFVHVKEGKQRGQRRTNRAGTCSGSTVLRERSEGFGSSARQDLAALIIIPMHSAHPCNQLPRRTVLGGGLPSQGLRGGSEPPRRALLGSLSPCRLLLPCSVKLL